jgi:hypothetical protein
VNRDVIAAAYPDVRGPDKFTSFAGMIKRLAAYPAALYQPDEFQGFVSQAIGTKRDGWLMRIFDGIKEMYESMGSYIPTNYKDDREDVEIYQPNFVMLATGVKRGIGRQVDVRREGNRNTAHGS